MTGRWLSLAAVGALALPGCDDGTERIKAKQAALEKQKAELEAKKESGSAPGATEAGPKHPYWDDPSYVLVRHEAACPEGLWALFPGRAPGRDDAARKENEARRAELAKDLREKTFVAKLRGPPELNLKDFDAPKGHFPLEVAGLVDCEDSIGRIAFGFTSPKAIDPKSSKLEEGNPLVQSLWSAPPQAFTLPMESMSAAKAFVQKHRFGLEGYVVFKLGKTDVHRKLVKIKKVTQGEVSIGGSTDDFGAGRMVRGDLQGVRVIAHPGPLVLVDTREPSAVTLK